MVSEPAYIRAFKAYTRDNPTLADMERLNQELYGASDRATAVLLGSMLDSALKYFISEQLRPTITTKDKRALLDERGPLGTFSAKILTAYAFNLFGLETRSDLDIIRTIRNEFAHASRAFGFDTPVTAEMCRKLQSPEWQTGPLPFTIPIAGLGSVDHTNPRTRYLTACHVITYGLVITASSVKIEGYNIDLR